MRRAPSAPSERTGQVEVKQKLIRGPQLRKRWANMPESTFHDLRAKGLIPRPIYPFGPTTPYWDMDVIEAHERVSQKVAA